MGVNNKTIKYHHIMCVYAYQLSGKCTDYKLKLCDVEVDAAVWISSNKLRSIIKSDNKNVSGKLSGMQPNGKEIVIKMEYLQGIYLNDVGQGIARGHRYGIMKLLDRLETKSKEPSKL